LRCCTQKRDILHSKPEQRAALTQLLQVSLLLVQIESACENDNLRSQIQQQVAVAQLLQLRACV
jgi:hypothetical protein